jgi:hypothetical protein
MPFPAILEHTVHRHVTAADARPDSSWREASHHVLGTIIRRNNRDRVNGNPQGERMIECNLRSQEETLAGAEIEKHQVTLVATFA